MKKIITAFILILSIVQSVAQKGRDETLANSYFQNGEFDKAAEILQELWEKNNQSVTFYTPLFKSLIELKKYDEAEKIVKRQIKKFADQNAYTIDLGYLYTKKNELPKSKDIYEKVIKNIRPNDLEIRGTAEHFKLYNERNFEIAAYEKGEKLFKGNMDYSFEIANAYLSQADYVKSANSFLVNLERHPELSQQVKNVLQTAAGADKVLPELETQLYAKIQKQPEQDQLVEFLTWIYLQSKDFEGAIVQMKALDKRKNENGLRVLNVARMAQTEGFYDDAISGFEYVISKVPKSNLYFQARTEALNCRKEKIAKTINYTQQDLVGLRNEYLAFIEETGKNNSTAQSIYELAEIEGLYLHDIKAAITTAEDLIKLNGIQQTLKNKTKLLLGDLYIIDGEMWESSLLYSQVDKQEKDSPLGEEARFKNAKLSYYKGDFEWAQAQLEVLKSSTSELISNDAINLSSFIIDNLGLDTTSEAMERYAQAELLLFQNKNEDALVELDSIIALFPGHALYDDIAYSKAKIFCNQRKFDAAVPLLEHIMKDYSTDLKGDDATFLLAEINEKELKNIEKAKELYKTIITQYSNSLLVIEARKRFRSLRGDKLE